ncbi:MAG: hypothetical protein ABIH26_01220 [Candidatus Eisenbacteria bacterium]
MRVFVGWSGGLSHRVALVLHEWLSDVLHPITAFVSSEDIDKGARWSSELAAVLKECSFGIFCIVPGNARAPWMNFEAGAIIGAIPNSRATTFLLGVEQAAIQDTPFALFQSTIYNEADVLRLVRSINAARTENRRDEANLKRSFEVWWPHLKPKLDELLLEAARQPSRADVDRSYASRIEEDLDAAADDWWKHRLISLNDNLFRHIAANLSDFTLSDRQLGFLAVVSAYYGEQLGRFAEIAENNPVAVQALAEFVAIHEHSRPVWRAAAILERTNPEIRRERLSAALAGPLESDERRLLLTKVIPEGSTYEHVASRLESVSSDAEKEKIRRTLKRLKSQLGEPEPLSES